MRIHSWILIFVLVFGLAACSDDEGSPSDPGEGGDFPEATTPDLAMQAFVNSWEVMNIAEYSKLLNNEFQFFLDPADNLGPVVGGESWGLEAELGLVTALFSNQPGQDPITEEPLDPISAISFQVFDPLDGEWQLPPEEPRYEGTVRQRYQVSMLVTYQGGANYTRVSGLNYFYLTNVGDASNPLWQIKIWEDRASTGPGNKSGTEENSWGQLKAWWVGN